MPVPPGAIDHPQVIPPLLRPARPLPTGPERPASHRPVSGQVDAPRAEALARAAAATVRGPIGSTATVGPNGARMGAPGIAGTARQNARLAERAAIESIGRHLDARA
ncbi:MAG TPA: hypothetical protein VGL23_13935 [Chloroflexota bacterium]